MRKFILMFSISLTGFNVWGQVPRELQDLLPAGKNTVRLSGATQDQKKCVVSMAGSATSYSLEFFVLTSAGQVDHRRMGKLQVGFGHEVQDIKVQEGILTVVTAHEAEESYSSDSRSTIRASLSGGNLKAVQLTVEEKGFFGFKTKFKEVCEFQK